MSLSTAVLIIKTLETIACLLNVHLFNRLSTRSYHRLQSSKDYVSCFLGLGSYVHSSCACLLHPKSRNQGKGIESKPPLRSHFLGLYLHSSYVLLSCFKDRFLWFHSNSLSISSSNSFRDLFFLTSR